MWQLLQAKSYGIYFDMTDPQAWECFTYHAYEEFDEPYSLCAEIEQELSRREVSFRGTDIDNRRRKFNDKINELTSMTILCQDAWLSLLEQIVINIDKDKISISRETVSRLFHTVHDRNKFLLEIKKMNLGLMPKSASPEDYDSMCLDGTFHGVYFEWADSQKTCLSFRNVEPSGLCHLYEYIKTLQANCLNEK